MYIFYKYFIIKVFYQKSLASKYSISLQKYHGPGNSFHLQKRGFGPNITSTNSLKMYIVYKYIHFSKFQAPMPKLHLTVGCTITEQLILIWLSLIASWQYSPNLDLSSAYTSTSQGSHNLSFTYSQLAIFTKPRSI